MFESLIVINVGWGYHTIYEILCDYIKIVGYTHRRIC